MGSPNSSLVRRLAEQLASSPPSVMGLRMPTLRPQGSEACWLLGHAGRQRQEAEAAPCTRPRRCRTSGGSCRSTWGACGAPGPAEAEKRGAERSALRGWREELAALKSTLDKVGHAPGPLPGLPPGSQPCLCVPAGPAPLTQHPSLSPLGPPSFPRHPDAPRTSLLPQVP